MYKRQYHNGIFRGVFQTNQCSNDKWGYCPLCDPPQYLVYANHSANCVNQTVPAPQYDPKDGPHAASSDRSVFSREFRLKM